MSRWVSQDSTCKCVKKVCDILQVTHTGIFVVKISKLKMLATGFNNIKVHEKKKNLPFILN